MTAFSADAHREHGHIRLELAGDLDLGARTTFDRACLSAAAASGGLGLVIDLSELEFCDLAGQRGLLRCRADGSLLVGAPPCVQRLFELTGHSELLSVDLRSEALHLPIRDRCPVPALAALQLI